MDPKICPYLGLVDDPNTSTSFPYEGNACYRAKKPTPVALSHQRGYCLSDEHTHCPGYINGWAGGFPESLQARQPVLQKVFRSKLAWASLGVIILISLLLPHNTVYNPITISKAPSTLNDRKPDETKLVNMHQGLTLVVDTEYNLVLDRI